MWWSRRRGASPVAGSSARLLGVLLALGLGVSALASLGACGFEPVYGTASQVRHPELGAIEVSPIRSGTVRAARISLEDTGRSGQELRNHLITLLGTRRVEPRYRLDVKLAESQTELAVQADDKVTRYNLELTAGLNLVEIESGKLLYQSNTRSVSSYNIVDSEFATVTSQKNARSRAAEDLAYSIRDLLIVYFSREPGASTPP